MKPTEIVNRCSTDFKRSMRECGSCEFDRFALSTMATNSLYDCANNQSPDLFNQYIQCNIPWNRNEISYQIYERNGEIKRGVPLQDLPVLGYCEPKKRRNYSLYN